MTKTRQRANGEGSIYAYRNGFAAYVWVDKPDGTRDRKYVYGKTRDVVHEKWVALQVKAKEGVMPTSTPTVAQHVAYWLEEYVKPELAPLSYVSYESLCRLYVVPHLGGKKLNKLTVRDVRTWLNKLKTLCQCCVQGKDAARPADHKDVRRRPRCCAIGKCCKQATGQRTINAARDALRAMLGHAMTEELLTRNVAALVKMSKPRKRKFEPWSVEEAKTFLEFGKAEEDPLYAAWVLVLVLGLRRGEVLGLTWDSVDLDAAKLTPSWQIQRAGRQLLHRETKTEASDTSLPLPDVCVAALKLRREQQEAARRAHEDRRARQRAAGKRVDPPWPASDLVFTTGVGTSYEPGNLTKMFPARSRKAGVRVIRLHDTRHTCGSLLVALGVHPRVVMEIMRHTQIAITMEIYSHVPSADTRAALKQLGDSLG